MVEVFAIFVPLFIAFYGIYKWDAYLYPIDVHTEVCEPLKSEGFECDCGDFHE